MTCQRGLAGAVLLGGQRQVASRGKRDELGVLGVYGLKARHRERHVAVAAMTYLALDVIERLDYDLRLLRAA
jgi:hypothetical protein